MKRDTILWEYMVFVDSVTSNKSKFKEDFIDVVNDLSEKFDVPRLLTASIGLSGEVGEFSDLVKKVFFHGKEFNDMVKDEMVKELGDIMWYWINACKALNLDPYEVIEKNVEKLKNRYPKGFTENRKGN